MPTEHPLPAFTPVFEWVANATDSWELASVYSVVWRYAQMQHGTCHASCSRMADRLHWSRQRVMRHLAVLCDEGFILCTNPDELGVVRHYLPVSEAEWRAPNGEPEGTAMPCSPAAPEPVPPAASPTPDAPVTAQDALSQPDTACPTASQPPAVTHRDTPCHAPSQPPVTHRDAPCHATSPGPVTPCDTNKSPQESLKRDSKRGASESTAPAEAAGARARAAAVQLITSLLGWRPPVVLHGRIAAAIPPGTTAADLQPYLEAWCTRGFKPRNLAWLFEWYVERRIPEDPPPRRARGQPATPAAADTPEDFAKWARYEEAIRKGEDPDEVKRRLGL